MTISQISRWRMASNVVVLRPLSCLCFILLAAVPSAQAGEAELKVLMSKMESDVLELAGIVGDAYEKRCAAATFDNCANSQYDECASLFPDQSCIGGSIYGRPECAIEGLSCSGLFDFTVSNVRLSENVVKGADGNPTASEVKETLCYSEQTESYMIEKFNDGKSYWSNFAVDPPQMYFGADNGVLRIYPARPSEKCGEFDPTNRPWYVAATTGPKDVVLILDTSGSMRQRGRWDLMQIAAARVIDTLAVGDHIGVVSFDTNASFVGQGNLIQATTDNKEQLKAAIGNLNNGGSTNFLDAFTKAFDMINVSTTLEYTSYCHTAILFLTDGRMTGPDGTTAHDVINYIKQREGELRVSPYIFVYGLGSDAQYGPAADDLKQIACATGGMWSLVEDGGDLASSMANYYKLFAFGLGDYENEGFVAWVEPYEFATGGILGTSVSAPVYDRQVDPPVLVGAVGIDFAMSAMDAALGVEAGSRETLNRLINRSTATCPVLNLTECDIQSLRFAAGGEEALCQSQCMNFTGIAPKSCRTVSDYPTDFWNNVRNRGKSFAERACCAIGETRINGEVTPSNLQEQSNQCMAAAMKAASKMSNRNIIIGVAVGCSVGVFVLFSCVFVLLKRKMRQRGFPKRSSPYPDPVPVPPMYSPDYYIRSASAPPTLSETVENGSDDDFPCSSVPPANGLCGQKNGEHHATSSVGSRHHAGNDFDSGSAAGAQEEY